MKKMKEIESLDEVKQIGLNGLVAFDNFCREYKLKYSIAAGTMIGAVRHKGFIPWDDDVDLYMDRNEYDKLILLVKEGKQLPDESFDIYLPELKNYIYPFIKIVNNKTLVFEKNVNKKFAIGVWLDIFPLDNCGDSMAEAQKIMHEMTCYSKKLMRTVTLYDGKNLEAYFKNIYVWVYKYILRRNYHIYKHKKICFKFPEGGRYKGNLIWPWLEKGGLCDIYPAEYFDGYTEIEFEGRKFMIFSHYDEILQKRYGDYMTLPKEKDRVGHEFHAYYLD